MWKVLKSSLTILDRSVWTNSTFELLVSLVAAVDADAVGFCLRGFEPACHCTVRPWAFHHEESGWLWHQNKSTSDARYLTPSRFSASLRKPSRPAPFAGLPSRIKRLIFRVSRPCQMHYGNDECNGSGQWLCVHRLHLSNAVWKNQRHGLWATAKGAKHSPCGSLSVELDNSKGNWAFRVWSF